MIRATTPKHSSALELIFEAEEREQVQYFVVPEDWFTTNSMAVNDIQPLGRFLANEADRLAAEDPGKAWRCIASGLRLANTQTEDPLLICVILRSSMIAQVLDGTKLILGTASISTDSAEHVRRVLDALRDRSVMQQAIDWELATFASMWQNIDGASPIHSNLFRPIYLGSQIGMYEMYRTLREISLEPHYARKPKLDELEANTSTLTLFQVPAIALPNFTRSMLSFEEDVSTLDLLDIVIALEQYHQDEGEYPDALDALAPRYIAELPIDPFSGQSYIYALGKQAIYGVGPNGTNDNGTSDDILWTIPE